MEQIQVGKLMEYITKQNNPPLDWENWFTTATGRRSFDYEADCAAMRNLPMAKAFLLAEQHYLCAYCQSELTAAIASIEHVVPKSQNKALSTVYFNLVAVCKNPFKDSQGRRTHCDKERGNLLLPPIIFYKEAQCVIGRGHKYFVSRADGQIYVRHDLPQDIKEQAIAFINILNLNNDTLVQKRKKDVLEGILIGLLGKSNFDKQRYLESQYARILQNLTHPFRQFLLTFLGGRLGIN